MAHYYHCYDNKALCGNLYAGDDPGNNLDMQEISQLHASCMQHAAEQNTQQLQVEPLAALATACAAQCIVYSCHHAE